ncbi:MAG: SUMF1/EgtB/PvdO family nonheme iron enzyme [Brasilonema angustatum HA4187-MV1]|jgi:formylglycine-generating enzyme required for sulfatase activity|nr:SUMF1/EgtB/PvdO family nonheme iron enzyme [Brasilonema angustatum HA4187-MV1]
MVAIPSGSFLMGSPEDELDHDESESPQHEVIIKLFCMGKYPLTQAQWKGVPSVPKVKHKLDSNSSEFKGAPTDGSAWLDNNDNDNIFFCCAVVRGATFPVITVLLAVSGTIPTTAAMSAIFVLRVLPRGLGSPSSFFLFLFLLVSAAIWKNL